jgi:hypothetical protein
MAARPPGVNIGLPEGGTSAPSLSVPNALSTAAPPLGPGPLSLIIWVLPAAVGPLSAT